MIESPFAVGADQDVFSRANFTVCFANKGISVQFLFIFFFKKNNSTCFSLRL